MAGRKKIIGTILGFLTLLVSILLVNGCTVVLNYPPQMPTNPNPSNNSTNVDGYMLTLSWVCSDQENDKLYYDVYFGESPDALEKIAEKIQTNSYTIANKKYEILEKGKKYYWKVVVNDGKNKPVSGILWEFTTSENYTPRINNIISPKNNEKDVSLTPKFEWEVMDPDNDKLYVDLYIGTGEGLTKVAENIETNNYTLPESMKLASKTKYEWKILVKDSNGAETESGIYSFTTLNSTPTAITITYPRDGETLSATTNQVNLTWECSDPDGDVLTYDIYFGTNENPPLVKSGHTSKNYLVTNLENGRKYYWKIVAKDPHDSQMESNISNFRVNSAPITPVNVSPSNGEVLASRNEITLKWECSDPDGDTLTYDIYFGTNNNPPLVKSGHTDKTYLATGLESGKRYYWKIVAKDSHGDQIESNIWNFRVNGVPTIPVNMSPNNGEVVASGTEVALKWECSDPDGDTLTYDIYFGTSSNPPLIKSGHTDKTYLATGLESGRNYYWKIVAKDAYGGRTESSIWNFRVNAAPNVPVNVSPTIGETLIGKTEVTLKWECSDPDGDTLTYDIYFGTNNNPPLIKSGHSSKTYLVTGLEFGKTYYWKVVAKDGKGGVTEGSIWNFVTNVGTYKIELTWLSSIDLDSHLTGPYPPSDRFHVYYSNKLVNLNGEKYAELDRDSANGGPENIFLYKVLSGKYSYYVHNYSGGSSNLSSSQAVVKIYLNNVLIRTINVPTNSQGVVWYVFDIENNSIILKNEFYDSTSVIQSITGKKNQ